ncbi:hypothetical protein H6F43_16030 [Leptolyngbya sp. FACHB-36]|uniref:hypothetical protein n=1 Tax=Leptolyngbya sp. FACHB-36 TaxID=2692808 RepID=UPI0016811D51|nr:hypothetical protein [Leptolyngbya sp. FACHB-36]MBD2021689.1 hypothetical protein [Leptolyngbya sp. FACHB-36]
MPVIIIDLLVQWSDLEPQRCAITRAGIGSTVFDLRFTSVEVEHSLDLNPVIAAIVQSAVQRAITARQLRFSLVNANEYHVSLMEFEGSAIAWRCKTEHAEPAIALLEAYLRWLEREGSPCQS